MMKTKKNKQKVIVIVSAIVCISLAVAVGILFITEQNEPVEITTIVDEYVGDYTVMSSSEEGVIIKVEAPDFAKLFEIMFETYEADGEVSLEIMENAILENPELTTEYEITVESESDDLIEEAIIDKISYEMLIRAMVMSHEEE